MSACSSPPAHELPIPVSCVEQGRWRHVGMAFMAAPHAAHPELRRRKAESLRMEPLARGVSQGEVWDEVREKNLRMDVRSSTGASADVVSPLGGASCSSSSGRSRSSPGSRGAVLALGDDALPRLRLAAGSFRAPLSEASARATCWMRWSGSIGLPGRTSPGSSPRSPRPRGRAGASAGLGEDLRLERRRRHRIGARARW